MNIIVMGVQGSGKGTQAELLKDKYAIAHICTGEMFREGFAKGTLLGVKAHAYWSFGNLVPDDIVNGLVKERISELDCTQGFVLDGFPRTVPQAEFLEQIVDIDIVINLDISEAVAVRRFGHRVSCVSCGKLYGIDVPSSNAGVCDECGGRLEKRADDTPEKIAKRLQEYHQKTKPLLEFYQKKGIVYTIDASKSIERVHEELVSLLT
mgnify:CR=1 FL=1